MQGDHPSKSLQADLLTLLCFDDKNASFIRNSVPIDLFESLYKEVAQRVYAYIDQYQEAPKNHIDDEFSDILEGDDKRKKKALERLLVGCYEIKDTINSDYVISRITEFVRRQNLHAGVYEAARILQDDDEDASDRAEEVLNEFLKRRLDLFDPGTFLNDPSKVLRFLDEDDQQTFNTGIKEIDKLGLGPIRKGLHLFVALPKSGKTFYLVNLGKRALMQRQRVCHITLEMSEDLMAQRYLQTWLAIAKRKDKITIPEFITNEFEAITGIDFYDVEPKLGFSQENYTEVYEYLVKKIEENGLLFKNLVIKQFPTGMLSLRGLEAYLDSLESQSGFVPDLLIVDYADLMSVEGQEYRIALGKLYEKLRGVGVSRNIAVATASQANRAGVGAQKLDMGNVAEDFSKIATADSIITFMRTDAEKALNLARLYVAGGRSDEDGFMVAISQNYAMGQFVRSSARLNSRYWDELQDIMEGE